MANASLPLSAQDAERLRRFERQRHDSLAATYHDFFTPITALAIQPLLDAARAGAGEAIAEVGAALPPDVPPGHSNLRFSDTAEFRKLLVGAGLDDVRVEDHRTTYTIADVDTLWRGGLGSFAVTASAIVNQDAATQGAIRASLERRSAAYRTPAGLVLPIAFKIGSGQKA